jgi:hypothetical protein
MTDHFGFIYSETHEVYTWREYGAVGLGLFKLAGSWVRYNTSKKIVRTHVPGHGSALNSPCDINGLALRWLRVEGQ